MWEDQLKELQEKMQQIQPEEDAGTNSAGSLFYRNTYTIVSTTAYLLGVPVHIFQNEHESPRMHIYKELEQNKHARIIRNLCMLRTAIERNFANINEKMFFEYANLTSVPEYVPQEILEQLSKDGISLVRANHKLIQYIIDINMLIKDRINNCKDCYPMWINWQYVKDIFIMPDGLTEEGAKNAAGIYFKNKDYYPYRIYLNWPPSDQGNILYNDKKFVTLLYQWNGDEFTDLSKVSDARYNTKSNIYDFLEASQKTVLVVDCENSDPYKLCAVLKGLDPEDAEKISKVILFDDVHTTAAWEMLEQFVSVPIERILIERIKQNKSLVDIRLTADTCREFYQNQVDSFILVSSDSDYWGLISSLPEARFIVMIERGKCSPDMKTALSRTGIFYCFIDDFYSGDNTDIQIGALIHEAYKFLDRTVQLNVNDLMEHIFQTTRVTMSDVEKKQFYERYIRPMHLTIENDGNVKIELKPWK